MTIFVLEMAGKARIPGCLMNVVKMADGRWLMLFRSVQFLTTMHQDLYQFFEKMAEG
jgi:hypothetical protein